MKTYAEKQHKSLSELVEDYFKETVKPKKRRTFIDIVKESGGAHIDSKAGLKQYTTRIRNMVVETFPNANV